MAERQAYFFNPTCEMEVANGLSSYTPPAFLVKFSEDLEMLPFVYASSDDCVLVRHLPSAEFLNRLEDAGFRLPSFRLVNKPNIIAGGFVPSPWGWSPAVANRLKSLGAKWDDVLRPFFNRQFALEISLILQEKCLPRIVEKSRMAKYVESLTDVEKLLMEWGKVVIKAPFSSSGRGIQMLRGNHLDINIINKTRSLIEQQGGVMVEPMMDTLCDFAYEFKIKRGTVYFVGFSSFTTDDKGQYVSHLIPFDSNSFPKEVAHLWEIGVVNAALDELTIALQNSDLPKHYDGYFGVDAFVFRHSDGQVLLQPCVEINLRKTMGIVALHLEKHIAAGSRCEFKIDSNPPIPFSLIDLDLSTTYPIVMSDGKIVSGYLPLTPPTEEAKSMAYIVVTT